ncbi:MAG: SMP-30/gluconolactonase/LRE family protein [Acidobacteria bacterium]|nr:SMP-30/gluconolactonase/LRE family protein [Acidobacteriota bacterium]
MTHFSQLIRKISAIIFASLAGALAAWIISVFGIDRIGRAMLFSAPAQRPGQPRMVSYQPLFEMANGEICLDPFGGGLPGAETVLASASPLSHEIAWIAALWQQDRARSAGGARLEGRQTVTILQPQRTIRDPYPAFSSVAVNLARDEAVVTDENLFQILVFPRRAHTPAPTARTEPKRAIAGMKTKIEFQCGLYIDPASGEIYAVNNDTVDTLVIFSATAEGDVAPNRELHTPHGTFGIAVDEARQEFFLTIQHDNAVVTFRKAASGEEAPVRLLQGERTGLADPHGIAFDPKQNLIFVANQGSFHKAEEGPAFEGATQASKANWPRSRAERGSGRFLPPSITVYSSTAAGNVAPLRTIQGPKTRLNWPAGLALDPDRRELLVANDMEDAILVFSADASGDVAPARILRGPRTGLDNPTGLVVDAQNDELWVANFGNHTATVYRRGAGGDEPPLRIIRGAPADKPSLMIGNPGSIAYDGKRQEILVPN